MRALQRLLLIFTFLSAAPVFAQLQLTPHTWYGKPPVTEYSKSARTKAIPLQLPFFDDFSAAALTPTDSLWINGGVIVNNQFVRNPPSKGVVTFDGLSFSGKPYLFDNTIIQAPADTLTSRPIDLSGLSATSNVVLSFYWQPQGLGERPDPGDSLVLQFKTADDWRTVWSQRGNAPQAFMKDTAIAITNASFLHNAFQFRFRMYGRPSGLYDVWHLDYVYLDKGRDVRQRFVRDLTVSRTPKSLLKRYMAMPFEQYNVNPAGELATSDSTVVNNLHDDYNFFPLRYTITDVSSGSTLLTYQASVEQFIEGNSGGNSRLPVGISIPANTIPATNGPKTLKATFSIRPEVLEPVIKGVDLRKNDTISAFTVLDDYYAYDDGSAEYGIYMTQRLGQVAVRYVLNKPSAITSVKVYFTKLQQNLQGQAFVLKIWKKLDNQAESVLFQRSYPVRYTDTLNKFSTYTLLDRDNLETSVAVSDTFYIGWQQPVGDNIIFGYDTNTDSKGQQFFNITGDNSAQNWKAANQQAGSIMVRPVFGKVPLAVEESLEEKPVALSTDRLFPNPTSGLVQWEFPGVRSVKVYDLLGRPVSALNSKDTAINSVNLSGLPDGIYLIHLQIGPKTVVNKVILKK